MASRANMIFLLVTMLSTSCLIDCAEIVSIPILNADFEATSGFKKVPIPVMTHTAHGEFVIDDVNKLDDGAENRINDEKRNETGHRKRGYRHVSNSSLSGISLDAQTDNIT
eukprot:558019_1